MTAKLCLYSSLLIMPLLASSAAPVLPGIGAAIQKSVDARDISGAVTVVVTKDKVIHCEATGLANPTNAAPMTPDTLFWIASMTKPVTAAAILMLQDEGKLKVTDPVAKYLPEFAGVQVLDGFDGDRIIVDVERAGRLARRRADAAGEFREIIGRMQVARRLVPTVAVDEVVPVRNLIVDRAAGGRAELPAFWAI